MAVYGNQQRRTYEADSDFSGDFIYNIMRIASADTQRINVASASNDRGIVGVLQNQPDAAGRFASVAAEGYSKVRAGGSISSVAIHITTNGSGRAAAASSGDTVIGRAMETANADGDIIEAELNQPWILTN